MISSGQYAIFWNVYNLTRPYMHNHLKILKKKNALAPNHSKITAPPSTKLLANFSSKFFGPVHSIGVVHKRNDIILPSITWSGCFVYGYSESKLIVLPVSVSLTLSSLYGKQIIGNGLGKR